MDLVDEVDMSCASINSAGDSIILAFAFHAKGDSRPQIQRPLPITLYTECA